MSLKTKLTSLITTFILLCSLLTVGVFAVKNTTFNVGGDIVFDVKGIEADIELTANGVQNAVLADNAVAGTDVMNKIEIRNYTSAESVASQFAKWSNLDMTFAEGQSTATIELKISNVASEEDNYIDITALADATTKENARIKVANNAGGITALLKSGENATFTITFSVIDDEYKASLNDFSVNFDMQKKVKSDFPSYDAVEGLTFSCVTTAKTATLTDGTSAEGEVVIPAYVQKENVVCAVISIEGWAFEECSLTSITIPNSVTSIGPSVFASCQSLSTVSIGNGVTSIGSAAFEACSVLTSITIPASVEIIGEYWLFSGCDSLTSIVVESGNSVYDSRNNCNAIIETATNTLIYGSANTIIPNTVISIGDTAFSYYTNLTSITIPDSVTSIGDRAFEHCDSLTSITIPDSVTSIGSVAFEGCSSLSTVNYTGTQAQWNAIVGLANASFSSGATINFNYTGE